MDSKQEAPTVDTAKTQPVKDFELLRGSVSWDEDGAWYDHPFLGISPRVGEGFRSYNDAAIAGLRALTRHLDHSYRAEEAEGPRCYLCGRSPYFVKTITLYDCFDESGKPIKLCRKCRANHSRAHD